jgi:hypothetical protein
MVGILCLCAQTRILLSFVSIVFYCIYSHVPTYPYKA